MAEQNLDDGQIGDQRSQKLSRNLLELRS